MNPEDFIKEAEDFIYKEVAKNANLLLGKNKTAALSTGLFLKLPIEVAIEKTHQPLPKMYKELKTFMPYFSAYVKHGDTTKVFFTFMYHEEKDLKAILNHLPRHSVFLAFVYMHEVQHILRKHVTKSYNTMMENIAGDVAFPNEIINIAEDHAINYSLKDLFMLSSTLKPKWQEIEDIGMYNKQYHQEKLSDIDILKLLIKEENHITKQQISDMMSAITCDGKTMNQPTKSNGGPGGEEDDKGKGGKVKAQGGKPDKCSTDSDDADISMADLSESLQDIISSNTKGSQAGELFEQLFSSIKVETGWFKKIKASFKRQVYYKTHDYSTSWANLNNTYRRIYKSPKKQFIDNKINIILSVDHSGSMNTEDLQKLLYLIESESIHIASLKVLIHDTRVIQEFNIEDDYDIAASPEFSKALATRYTSGGTSHRCVFEHIEDMKLPDPGMVIYMSFSDNYSDIDSEFRNFPTMRKLTNYWICAGANNPVSVPGTNILMV